MNQKPDDGDPKTAADRKRRLLLLNKKNVTSKRAKPAPPLSDITSSIVNSRNSEQSKSSKENTEAYLPGLGLSGHLCENIQPSINRAPLPTQTNVQPLQVTAKVSRQKKKVPTSDKKARSNSKSTDFAINMPRIQFNSQYNSANQKQLPNYNQYLMDSTHTFRRNVSGFTPLQNIQNLPAYFSTSKEFRGGHVNPVNMSANLSIPVIDTCDSSSQGIFFQRSSVQQTSTVFPINMPNIECSSQYHITNHTQLSNLNSNTFHSTQTVRRNVPGLNLLNKFDATIQPDKYSSTSAKVGKKRNAGYTDNIINNICSQDDVVNSIEQPVQIKKTKFARNLGAKHSKSNSISHSIPTNTTELSPVKISTKSMTKGKIVPTSDVNGTSTNHDQSSNSSSCSQVRRKRIAEYMQHGNNPTVIQKEMPKSNFVTTSQPVHNILSNLLERLNDRHATVNVSSQDNNTMSNHVEKVPQAVQPQFKDQQVNVSIPQNQTRHKQIATDDDYFETMSRTIPQTTQDNNNINEDRRESDSDQSDHSESESDSEVDIEDDDEAYLQGKPKFQ